jgi:tetratricopeptide (TPR) repeat protein
VFMVGLGYFEAGAFHVAQFFMRGLEEEAAMLQTLAGTLGRFAGLVSFNGRSFDLPLLQTRFTLARMAPALGELPHFDLLFPARRLWRARLASCALSALETEILGVRRSYADVPSWQIPAMYADYLRYGDAQEMVRVFYHNQQDVLSMVALASHMCQLFTDPWGTPAPCAADLYSLGRLYESLSLAGEAERAYRGAIEEPASHTVHDHAMRHLSFLLKRQEQWEEAARLWWRVVADGRQLYPYVELAKYYEWQMKDYARALAVTCQALDRLRALRPGPRRRRIQGELEHRQSRLERKLARSDPGPPHEAEA